MPGRLHGGSARYDRLLTGIVAGADVRPNVFVTPIETVPFS